MKASYFTLEKGFMTMGLKSWERERKGFFIELVIIFLDTSVMSLSLYVRFANCSN